MKQPPETIYSSESQLLSPHKLLGTMFADLRTCRFLAWRLFVRNIAAQHRQSVLGYLWLLMVPIVQTLLWVFLNSQNVINISATDIPYPAFVLTGTLLWQGFSESLTMPMQQIQASKQMLTKIHFPHEAIILAAMGQILVNFGIRLLLLFVIYIWFNVPISTTLLLAPLGILALIAFGMVLGLVLTPLSMLYDDVLKALIMGLSLWFFMTPVIYPTPTEGWAALVTRINPVTPLLETTRQWLTGSDATQIGYFTVVMIFTLVLGLCSWIIYRVAMPHLIQRIGS